ncbi:MAG TPA: DUF4178 domain-containing protein [Candidatus Saccharimonadales bacterium]|jgi:hypothetical protein|nr:DUF4178 domain-containing protein [Candidatus Saccharimonadales bacterium]
MDVVWTVILVLLLVAALAFAVVNLLGALKRKRKEREKNERDEKDDQQRKQQAEERANRSPVDLMVGGTVNYDDEWYDVKGKVSYVDAEGYTWFDYRLQNIADKTRRWVSLEKDEDWSITFWADLKSGRETLPDSPTSKTLVYEGAKFRLDERGQANYTVEGQTDLPHKAGSVRYADYEGDDGRYLSYEQYDDGSWEISIGEDWDPEKIVDLPDPHKMA